MRKTFSISQWEDAVRDRSDIRFDAFYLNAGMVSEAKGTVIMNGNEMNVCWLEDGKCYGQFKSLSDFDIKF